MLSRAPTTSPIAIIWTQKREIAFSKRVGRIVKLTDMIWKSKKWLSPNRLGGSLALPNKNRLGGSLALPNKNLSVKRGGQAHFAPKNAQNEPVPGGFWKGSNSIGSFSPDARLKVKDFLADPTVEAAVAEQAASPVKQFGLETDQITCLGTGTLESVLDDASYVVRRM